VEKNVTKKSEPNSTNIWAEVGELGENFEVQSERGNREEGLWKCKRKWENNGKITTRGQGLED
jgi:hypothetical protein